MHETGISLAQLDSEGFWDYIKFEGVIVPVHERKRKSMDDALERQVVKRAKVGRKEAAEMASQVGGLRVLFCNNTCPRQHHIVVMASFSKAFNALDIMREAEHKCLSCSRS